MKVAKWGNSLAVRLPAELVAELGLKEGDEVQVFVSGEKELAVRRAPSFAERLATLRRYRGRLPADFKFDRDEIYDHGTAASVPGHEPARVSRSRRRSSR